MSPSLGRFTNAKKGEWRKLSSEEEKQRREAVLRRREENKRTADLILKGTAKSEPVEVLCTDGQVHVYHVFAVSDADLADLFDSTGADLADLGNKDKLANNVKFLTKGAGLVTGTPDVAKTTTNLESMKLIMKAFELSGLTGGPKATSTPSSPAQSTQRQ
jgi:hypothetical protein